MQKSMKWEWVRNLFIGVIAVALLWQAWINDQQIEQDKDSCAAQNAVRKEINLRGQILRDFLTDAAEVRHHTGLLQIEEGNRDEAELNLKAARRWEAWAAEVHVLDIRKCEDLLAESEIQ